MNQILELSLPLRLGCMFGLGLFLGSFLNWVIYRLGPSHRGISPWSSPGPQAAPPSWFDCLPVLGWFWLRRQPAARERVFWVRALLIELATGVLLAGLYYWEIERLGLLPHALPPGVTPTEELLTILHVQFAGHAVLICFLIAATFIDIDEQIIPDAVTVPGLLLALLLSTIYPWWQLPNELVFLLNGAQSLEFMELSSPEPWPAWLSGLGDNTPMLIGFGCWWLWCFALLPRTWRGRRGLETALAVFWGRLVRDWYSLLILVLAIAGTVWIWLIWGLGAPHWQGLLSALVGMTVSSVLVWAVRLIGAIVLKQEAMGFGDVTLMAMIGAALGWQAGVLVFFLAPLAAVVIGLAQLLIVRKSEIPYGPFLCLATVGLILGWGAIWVEVAPIFSMFFTWGWLGWVGVAGFLAVLAALLALVQRAKALFRRPHPPETPPAAKGPTNATAPGGDERGLRGNL